MKEKIRMETTDKWLRVYLAGHKVADTRRARLVWEQPHYPTYFFPEDDILADLTPSGEADGLAGRRALLTVGSTEGGRSEAAAYTYPDVAALSGWVALVWSRMDHWFEEDEEVYVHPRDPYRRVDVLRSSRRIRIELDGTVVAESARPVLLFETGLPRRHYLPKTDVRLDLLVPSDRVTRCPYKGQAEYWTFRIEGRSYRDVIWSYPLPAAESAPIAGLMCFYDEKVDVFVDGEPQPRPETVFS